LNTREAYPRFISRQYRSSYRGEFGELPADPPLPKVPLPSGYGDLRVLGVDETSLIALVGEPRGSDGALAYVHRGCVFGDALGHLGCRRRVALLAALEAMKAEGRGVIVYQRSSGFGGCCVRGEERPHDERSGAAPREAVARLGLRGVRLLHDPADTPPALGLDVAAALPL
jgi:GTP cyclohydrolase II